MSNGIGPDPFYGLQLLPQHTALLKDSAITPEVAQTRGYRSVDIKAELKRLGFSEYQCQVPALLIPIYGTQGQISNYQIRPDAPRIDKKRGKPIKYETPKGSQMVLDVHPLVRTKLRDPKAPLFITEGIRKGDAAVSKDLCCIALLGVWNFRGTNQHGGKVALVDWEDIALNGRPVYICFDSDVMTKPEVHAALARLKPFLEHRDAEVALIYFPPGGGGSKVGLDEYFSAGHSVADLMTLATTELRGVKHDEASGATGPYQIVEGRLCWVKVTDDGNVAVPLCNFSAQVISEQILDDGLEERRNFLIEGSLATGTPFPPATVPVTSFSSMNWPVNQWGVGAVISAGQASKDRLREAIQLYSKNSKRERVFTHTGFRKVNNKWVFLNGGKILGQNVDQDGIKIELEGALSRYCLSPPLTGGDLKIAGTKTLGLLDNNVATDSISFPLWGATFISPLASFLDLDFFLWLLGGTGTLKSTMAALYLSFFGNFIRTTLPLSWDATINSIEKTAFLLKDLPLVIDDYEPKSGMIEAFDQQKKAQRLIHSIGNLSGRSRMRSDLTLRPTYIPRGLMISTGEQLPSGQSTLARLFPVEFKAEDIKLNQLTELQKQSSQFQGLMAACIQALADNPEGIVRQLKQRWQTIRAKIIGTAHLRVPEAVAWLMVGVEIGLSFHVEIGALSSSREAELSAKALATLSAIGKEHSQRIGEEDQADRFMEILVTLRSQGKICLDGTHQDGADLLGWRDNDFLYLLAEASYQRVAKFCREAGGYFPLKTGALHKALMEKELLVPDGNGRLTCREQDPNNQQVRVLKMPMAKVKKVFGLGAA